MKHFIYMLAVAAFFLSAHSSPSKKKFKALVLYENGGHHILFSKAAIPWLDKLAVDSNFSIDYINTTSPIDEDFLKKYQLFIQLDFPPYAWGARAEKAFTSYIEQGKGGWIGFHHATLLGEFDGYSMWQWFSNFMGDIRFTNYIAEFAKATVHVEDSTHPAVKNIPAAFDIEKDEWYTYNRSPRNNVHVLASVDEASYTPDSKIKMGDHPVIWTNEHYKARNIYIFMGHSPDLFENSAYTTLLRNSISWAAGK